MTTVRTTQGDPSGPQRTDPPWARLLYTLLQGRDGQWWRAILLVVPLLVLVLALAGLICLMITACPPAGWASGALSLALWLRRRSPI